MGKGKEKVNEGVLVIGNENPVTELVTKYKEFDTFFKQWVAKQSVQMEAAIVAAKSATRGAAEGLFMTPIFCLMKPQTSVMIRTRICDFAIRHGVSAGITCVIKRLTGKEEDFRTSLVAGFGAGVMVAVYNGCTGPESAVLGVAFAVLHGGGFKMNELLFPPPEDVFYKKTRDMLSSLGLDNYESNFKKGLLTDKTLPLLTESDLQDVKIPTGPRRLILDHIQREKKVKHGRWRSR